jgi:protein-S-isoprenylcysteine O-methyltransferase Ste14
MGTARAYPRDIPPLWFLAALLAMFALHAVWPVAVVVPPPWNLAGGALLFAALGLMVLAAVQFRRAGTGIRPFSDVTALVDAGPFRWTRNPMYVGFFSLALGVAVVLGTASPLVVPFALVVVLDRRFVRREEEFLRERLGEAYDAYCRRVRRWI